MALRTGKYILRTKGDSSYRYYIFYFKVIVLLSAVENSNQSASDRAQWTETWKVCEDKQKRQFAEYNKQI